MYCLVAVKSFPIVIGSPVRCKYRVSVFSFVDGDVGVDEFTMLDNGRMESLGGHDDMVMALALSIQATKEYRDSIVILDADVWQNRLGWANV